jgi:hypothetical protein
MILLEIRSARSLQMCCTLLAPRNVPANRRLAANTTAERSNTVVSTRSNQLASFLAPWLGTYAVGGHTLWRNPLSVTGMRHYAIVAERGAFEAEVTFRQRALVQGARKERSHGECGTHAGGLPTPHLVHASSLTEGALRFRFVCLARSHDLRVWSVSVIVVLQRREEGGVTAGGCAGHRLGWPHPQQPCCVLWESGWDCSRGTRRV